MAIHVLTPKHIVRPNANTTLSGLNINTKLSGLNAKTTLQCQFSCQRALRHAGSRVSSMNPFIDRFICIDHNHSRHPVNSVEHDSSATGITM